ncbi:hypothetical protein CEXT_10891 [Caerostris extrusa]|uniref:Uncharacterized protein n=1 Tax=Caerostris extrusa TaxID=172846 RepID=A0AAV4NTC8_CAEEX|nr:hypothetical protein CEXT_10891 [Caerostris extrusa]
MGRWKLPPNDLEGFYFHSKNSPNENNQEKLFWKPYHVNLPQQNFATSKFARRGTAATEGVIKKGGLCFGDPAPACIADLKRGAPQQRRVTKEFNENLKPFLEKKSSGPRHALFLEGRLRRKNGLREVKVGGGVCALSETRRGKSSVSCHAEVGKEIARKLIWIIQPLMPEPCRKEISVFFSLKH